jgi:hypothetical protein
MPQISKAMGFFWRKKVQFWRKKFGEQKNHPNTPHS